jgi:hypothetical protein
MLDATKWKYGDRDFLKSITIYDNQILPPLNNLPQNLISGQSLIGLAKSDYISNSKKLFMIEKISRIIEDRGSTVNIIPSHIISMKDLLDLVNEGGPGPIILQARLADAFIDFQNNIFPNVANGFNPQIINNKFY